jgi:hypothetical protein
MRQAFSKVFLALFMTLPLAAQLTNLETQVKGLTPSASSSGACTCD